MGNGSFRIVNTTKKSVNCSNCGFPLSGFMEWGVSKPSSSGKRRYYCFFCSMFLGTVTPEYVLNNMKMHTAFKVDEERFKTFWSRLSKKTSE